MFSFLSLSLSNRLERRSSPFGKNIQALAGGRCATLPEAGTYLRETRTKARKKISFYWQQVGFDSVSSQQRPRLDAFYT